MILYTKYIIKICILHLYFFAACASGWTSYGHTGRCYQYFTTRKSWDEAVSHCKSVTPDGKNGTLASIGDHFTNKFLSTLTTKQVWIGGHQDDNDNWTWTDGSRFRYSSWAHGQPNDANQKHIAFNFKTAGEWNDANMHAQKGFICQYSGNNFRAW